MQSTLLGTPTSWWFIVAVVLFILELFTPGFLVACFGIGALGGALASLIGLGWVAQTITFVAFSFLTLFFLRPYINRSANKKKVATGMEALIGREAILKEAITEDQPGSIALDGDIWRVSTSHGHSISQGTRVRIVSYQSLVLYVEPLEPEVNLGQSTT